MVRDPAEREKRTEKEGKGTNEEGIKRERGEEGEECGEREEVEEGWVAFLHSPPPVRGFLDGARASGEGSKRWRLEERREERDGGKGRGRCGFCLLPTFQSQS